MARIRHPLFQADIRLGEGESVSVPVWPIPFSIGRHPQDTYAAGVAGLWERHLVVDWVPGEGFVGTVHPDAMAAVSGVAFRRHRLRNGDEVQLGGLRVQFHLSRPERKSLRAREASFWLLVLAVVGMQALILARLLSEG